MKKTLLAIAAAGVLATTGVVAANGQDARGPVMTPVQYHDQNQYNYQDQYNQNQYNYQDQYNRENSGYDRSAAINEREARINDRIQRGIRDGRINEYEARMLQRQLNRIEDKERELGRDGRLSRRDTDELNRDLDRLADNVRRQMRD